LTLKEFVALQERNKIEIDWLNWRTGSICSVLANINRDSSKHPDLFTPQDFMPQLKEEEESPNKILGKLRLWNAAMGGTEIIRE